MDYSVPELNDVQEEKLMPAGPYDLVVVRKSHYEKPENGRKMIFVDIAFSDHPEAKVFTHVLMFPIENDKESFVVDCFRKLNRFLHYFKIPNENGNFDDDDFIDATATSLVSHGDAYRGGKCNDLDLPPVPDVEEAY